MGRSGGSKAVTDSACWPPLGRERHSPEFQRPGPCRGDEGIEAPHLDGGDLPAECGEPVVAAALIVELGIGPLIALLDQPVAEEALDRRVDRAGPEDRK